MPSAGQPCGLWLMDGWKRAEPALTVIVSQVYCLVSHFSGKAVIGMFWFGPVYGIGYIWSPRFERLGERRQRRSRHVTDGGSAGGLCGSPGYSRLGSRLSRGMPHV